MNILIIEDEEAAAFRLKKMLLQIDSTIREINITESIEGSVHWLKEAASPDLIFADIHLSDGSSFEIFHQVKVETPLIFTTAYDQYAVKAFKFNSIDYLLKPIKQAELEESFQKFKKRQIHPSASTLNYNTLISAVKHANESYQKRLVIRYGQNIRMVEIAEVAYFYTEEKVCFACTREGNRWPVDHTLDELESILDPSLFSRINRQYIIHIQSIESMHAYSKARVKVVLNPSAGSETIVSSERSAGFKEWLLGK